MPRILVQLADVTCWNTEDIQGADEFYIIGSIIASFDQQKIIRPVLTRPLSINDNQTVPFNLPAVFDAEVPDNWYLKFALVALDEDSSKDWSKFEQANRAIVGAAESGAAAAAYAGAPIIPGILESVRWFVRQDQDDILGKHSEHWYPVRTFPHGWQLMTWPFSGGSNFYSNWNYQVRYWVGKW
jgi:hypothetical protein